MTDADKVEDELHELCFYVQRCIRYHMRRQSFFMRWSRFTAFVGVIFGSAAAASLLANAPPEITIAAALLVTFSSAIDLVIGTGQRAWLHADLRKAYLSIEEEIMAQGTPPPESMRTMRSRIRRIEADEPPTLPALELLARNDVIRAIHPREVATQYLSTIPWYMRITAQWIEWDTSSA
jgi:hypothetical protein